MKFTGRPIPLWGDLHRKYGCSMSCIQACRTHCSVVFHLQGSVDSSTPVGYVAGYHPWLQHCSIAALRPRCITARPAIGQADFGQGCGVYSDCPQSLIGNRTTVIMGRTIVASAPCTYWLSMSAWVRQHRVPESETSVRDRELRGVSPMVIHN